jgi:hypothetical protein
MPDPTQTTDLDLAEQLIVQRLQRYAARTARNPEQAGLLKADKVISIVRERFSFIRSGRSPQRERGKGEKETVVQARRQAMSLTDGH